MEVKKVINLPNYLLIFNRYSEYFNSKVIK